MEIAIVAYRRFNEMPRDVYNQVRIMGHTAACAWKRGHLRDLANKRRYWDNNALKYSLRKALVMYVGDTIVGWAALYDEHWSTYPNASAWIKTKHRGKGYGSMLMEEMYKRWRHQYRPSVFNKVEAKWKALDAAAQGK